MSRQKYAIFLGFYKNPTNFLVDNFKKKTEDKIRVVHNTTNIEIAAIGANTLAKLLKGANMANCVVLNNKKSLKNMLKNRLIYCGNMN